MKFIKRFEKPSFSVVGKEGSTDMGEGFVQALWLDASSNFAEIAHLAKRKENGGFAGYWGCMTGPARSFEPFADGYTRGIYLAGAECEDGATAGTAVPAPEGWVKWTLPGFEYVVIERENDGSFAEGLAYLEENGLDLAGAQQDFVDPDTGTNYLYFPVRRL